MVWVYAVLTVPLGKVVGLKVIVGQTTLIVSVAVVGEPHWPVATLVMV